MNLSDFVRSWGVRRAEWGAVAVVCLGPAVAGFVCCVAGGVVPARLGEAPESGTEGKATSGPVGGDDKVK